MTEVSQVLLNKCRDLIRDFQSLDMNKYYQFEKIIDSMKQGMVKRDPRAIDASLKKLFDQMRTNQDFVLDLSEQDPRWSKTTADIHSYLKILSQKDESLKDFIKTNDLLDFTKVKNDAIKQKQLVNLFFDSIKNEKIVNHMREMLMQEDTDEQLQSKAVKGLFADVSNDASEAIKTQKMHALYNNESSLGLMLYEILDATVKIAFASAMPQEAGNILKSLGLKGGGTQPTHNMIPQANGTLIPDPSMTSNNASLVPIPR